MTARELPGHVLDELVASAIGPTLAACRASSGGPVRSACNQVGEGQVGVNEVRAKSRLAPLKSARQRLAPPK
jgi:hypothetical protein